MILSFHTELIHSGYFTDFQSVLLFDLWFSEHHLFAVRTYIFISAAVWLTSDLLHECLFTYPSACFWQILNNICLSLLLLTKWPLTRKKQPMSFYITVMKMVCVFWSRFIIQHVSKQMQIPRTVQEHQGTQCEGWRSPVRDVETGKKNPSWQWLTLFATPRI